MHASHRDAEVAARIEVDADGLVASADAKALSLLQGLAVGQPCPLIDRGWLRSATEQARLSGELRTHLCTTGDRLLEVTIVPLPATCLLIVRDETARRLHEEAVARREAGYRALVDASAQIVWRADRDGTLLEISPGWLALTGMTPAETRERWAEVVHPDDRAEAIAAWAEARRLQVCYEFELRIRAVHGDYRHYASRSVPVFDEAGHLREWVGSATDIEDRRQAEFERERLLAQIEAEKGRLSLVLEALPAGVLLAEPGGRIVLANRAVVEATRLQYLGRRPADFDEYEGYHANGDRYRPDDWPLSRTLATGEAVRGEELRYRRGDGSQGWLRVSTSVIRDETGVMGGAILHAVDVTDHRQVELALQASEARFRRLAELNVLGMVTWRADGTFLEANDEALRILGIDRSALPIYWLDYTAPESRAQTEAAVREMRRLGEPRPFEKIYLRPDGTRVPAIVAAVRDPGDSDRGVAFLLDLQRIARTGQPPEASSSARL